MRLTVRPIAVAGAGAILAVSRPLGSNAKSIDLRRNNQSCRPLSSEWSRCPGAAIGIFLVASFSSAVDSLFAYSCIVPLTHYGVYFAVLHADVGLPRRCRCLARDAADPVNLLRRVLNASISVPPSAIPNACRRGAVAAESLLPDPTTAAAVTDASATAGATPLLIRDSPEPPFFVTRSFPARVVPPSNRRPDQESEIGLERPWQPLVIFLLVMDMALLTRPGYGAALGTDWAPTGRARATNRCAREAQKAVGMRWVNTLVTPFVELVSSMSRAWVGG